jgi:hypothetical protein
MQPCGEYDKEAVMPSLRLKPAEGAVGTDVTVIGTGFRPNVGYRIQVESEWIRPGTTTNRGTFTFQIRIPPLPGGEQDVTVFSQAAQQLAHATFTVVPEIAHIEPREASVGDEIAVMGTGFGSSEPIRVQVGAKTVLPESEVKTRPDGSFTATFTATDELVSTAPEHVIVRGQTTGASAQSRERILISRQ